MFSRLFPLLACLAMAAPSVAMPELAWPTDNDALARNQPERFFMYVDRTFEGAATKPWEGGQFGFVRNPMRLAGRVVDTKFHEGMDIRPLRRDAAGVPQDPVNAVADGTVVHCSTVAGQSNYGNYVVVEHPTPDGPVYSLYAHLRSVSATPGQAVRSGDTLGILGCTGEGLNLERAHVHLEICLLLHSDFEAWHQRFAPGANHHGPWNGINLAGIDPSAIYLAQRDGRPFSLPAHVRSRPPAWRALLPLTNRFELPSRYPWLVDGKLDGAPSVEITFSREGLPIGIKAGATVTDEPRVVWVADTALPTTLFTNHRLTKQCDVQKLTAAGDRYVRLMGGLF